MIPHCLNNRFTDGGEIVSLTRRPRFAPQKHLLSESQGLVRLHILMYCILYFIIQLITILISQCIQNAYVLTKAQVQ
jgi:hypothetical protein